MDFPIYKHLITLSWLLKYNIRCGTPALFFTLSVFIFSFSHCFLHHISPRVPLKRLNNAQRVKGLYDGSPSSFWSCCILFTLKLIYHFHNDTTLRWISKYLYLHQTTFKNKHIFSMIQFLLCSITGKLGHTTALRLLFWKFADREV